MNQRTSVESALKTDLIFFNFEDYSESVQGMIFLLKVKCCCTPILHKTTGKPIVRDFSLRIVLKAQWIIAEESNKTRSLKQK